jgi:hypothetical protein
MVPIMFLTSCMCVFVCVFVSLLWFRFINGSDSVRQSMFKMIPHVEGGGWMIQKSVGTTPVILGNKMKQTYHFTPR